MSHNKMYSYGRQIIEEDDIQAVVNVLRSDWLTQGPNITAFEAALCAKFNAAFGSVVSNGTAALHLAALALGWGEGDVVLTTPITFLASANCILYAGATPDFVDIDPRSYTIDVNRLEEKLLQYRSLQKKVRAVVAVDYAGHPCDWRSLRGLADKYEFQLVNDSCHALGAEYENDIGYAAKYADAVILSFHPVKHITTGEGGAVLTNNKELDAKIKILRTHGMTKDQRLLGKNDGAWYYEMCMLGYNYRITDFQCALGATQLRKLDRFVDRRRSIARHYDMHLCNGDTLIAPSMARNVKHAYHLYPLQINFAALRKDKKEVFEQLKQHRIVCQVHYIPVHLQPYYRDHFGFKQNDFPVAEQFYLNELSIPMYPSLERADLDYICDTIRTIAGS